MSEPGAPRFAGRSVVVSGAASGIGAATARRFTAEGAGVVAIDLDHGAAAGTVNAADRPGAARSPGSANPAAGTVNAGEGAARLGAAEGTGQNAATTAGTVHAVAADRAVNPGQGAVSAAAAEGAVSAAAAGRAKNVATAAGAVNPAAAGAANPAERAVSAAEGVVRLVGDVAEPETWRRAAELAVERFGRLDVVVSNAFTVVVKPITETTPGEWARQLDVNLGAAYHALHTCLPLLADGGSVVLVSSVHAVVGLPGHPAYAAAKGALAALTRQVAVEYGPRVRVNCVLPGPILTAAWDRVPEPDRERSIAGTALRRFGRPEEVAAAIAFLASDDASFVTGASLVVDGGWTIQKDSA